jgi:hypothetical protein
VLRTDSLSPVLGTLIREQMPAGASSGQRVGHCGVFRFKQQDTGLRMDRASGDRVEQEGRCLSAFCLHGPPAPPLS